MITPEIQSYIALMAKDQRMEDMTSYHSDDLVCSNNILMARIVNTSNKNGSME